MHFHFSPGTLVSEALQKRLHRSLCSDRNPTSLQGVKVTLCNHIGKERRKSMALGPLEYLVIEFEGNKFSGRIMSELRAVQDKGIIRVVDLFFIKKDDSGKATSVELSNLRKEDARQLAHLVGDLLNLLTPEDIEQAAQAIPNNCAAALILFEHTWAIGLKDAIKDAGGKSVTGGLVSPDVLKELEEEIELAKQNAVRKQTPAETAS
jgi:hypothetical protein